MDNIFSTGITAVLTSTFLQMAKNNPNFDFISRDTGRLNAIIGVIVAGIGALGVSYSYGYDDTTGVFTLGFQGTLTGVFSGLWIWMKQWGVQQAFYKGVVVPAEAQGETRAILKKMMGERPQIKSEVPPTE